MKLRIHIVHIELGPYQVLDGQHVVASCTSLEAANAARRLLQSGPGFDIENASWNRSKPFNYNEY